MEAGRLGLLSLRIAAVLSPDTYDELKALLLNGEISLEDAVVLCSRKANGREFSYKKAEVARQRQSWQRPFKSTTPQQPRAWQPPSLYP